MIRESEVVERCKKYFDSGDVEVSITPGNFLKTYRADFVSDNVAVECKSEEGNIRMAFGQARTYSIGGYDAVICVPEEMNTKKLQMLASMCENTETCSETDIDFIILNERGEDISKNNVFIRDIVNARR